MCVRTSVIFDRRLSAVKRIAPELADTFNEFFSSIGARVSAELRSDVNCQPTTEQRAPRPITVCSSNFVLKPATLPELSLAIYGMSNSRAVGLDGVPMQAVKKKKFSLW